MTTAQPIPEQLEALKDLTRGHDALISLADIPTLLGLDPEVSAVVLDELLGLGLVQVWDHDPAGTNPMIIVTCLGGERLGLELTIVKGENSGWRWVPQGEGRDPGPGGDFAIPLTDASSLPFDAIDPTADDPACVAEACDEFASPARRERALARHRGCGSVPRPTIILGIGILWRTAHPKEGEPCPGCGGKPLRSLEYCAYESCDRSGAEWMIARLSPTPTLPRSTNRGGTVAKLESDATPLDGVSLAGGTGMSSLVAARLASLAREYRKAPPRKKSKERRPKAVKPVGNSFDLGKLR